MATNGPTKAQLTEELEAARAAVSLTRKIHEEFRVRVREAAIQAAEDEGWCKEGLNAALRELDLDPVQTKWTVQATVEVNFFVELGEDAGAVDEAFLEDYLRRNISVSVRDYTNTWQDEGATVINFDAEESEDY